MRGFDNLYVVHIGALGDLLTAWPAIFALRRRFPDRRLLAHTRPAHLPLLRPLAESCPPALGRILDQLPDAQSWPAELADSLVVRFALRPAMAGLRDPRLWHLAGLGPVSPDPSHWPCPREEYLRALIRHGLFRDTPPEALVTEARQAFGALFGPWGGRDSATVLLFPGAGHRLKAWPAIQFLELARALADQGLRPLFVLGPAEVERGFDTQAWPWVAPRDIPELLALLRQARAVVGNDSGPMHLAGMLGTPGVVLFGPTSRRQWAPLGLTALAAENLACRPCTPDTRALRCAEPRCLTDIPVVTVLRYLRKVLTYK